MDQRGLAYLYSQGITSTHFPRCLKYVEVTSLNVIYKGVGIRNVNGGMEFYCSELCSFPFTVSKRGITIVPFVEGHISRICCLFVDLLDYLSYLTLIERHGHPMPDGDCIIMGGPFNFMDLLPEISSYHCVYCYFPLTVAGQTMYRKSDRFLGKHADWSSVEFLLRYHDAYLIDRFGVSLLNHFVGGDKLREYEHVCE